MTTHFSFDGLNAGKAPDPVDEAVEHVRPGDLVDFIPHESLLA